MKNLLLILFFLIPTFSFSQWISNSIGNTNIGIFKTVRTAKIKLECLECQILDLRPTTSPAKEQLQICGLKITDGNVSYFFGKDYAVSVKGNWFTINDLFGRTMRFKRNHTGYSSNALLLEDLRQCQQWDEPNAGIPDSLYLDAADSLRLKNGNGVVDMSQFRDTSDIFFSYDDPELLNDSLLGMVRDNSTLDSLMRYYDARVSGFIPVRRQLTVEDFGDPTDQATWQIMLDSLKIVRGTKDAVYNVVLPSGVPFLKIGTTGNDSTLTGYEIDGQGCTIILPPSPSTKYLFQVLAQDVYIHDFNIYSTMTGSVDVTYPNEASSNWYGIIAETGIWQLRDVRIENVNFHGLAFGIRFKNAYKVDIHNVQMDSCSAGISCATSQVVNISKFRIDKDTFGSHFRHPFYFSNVSQVNLSDGFISGAGFDGGIWSRAISFNVTEFGFGQIEDAIQIDNVQIDSSGGVVIWGYKNAIINNLTIRNPISDKVLYIDSSNVTFNGLAMSFDSTGVIDMFASNTNIGRINVDGFVIDGAARLNTKVDRLSFSNGLFLNPLGDDGADWFVNTSGVDAIGAGIKFDNVRFLQNTPHGAAYLGRVGVGGVEFINCKLDFSQQPLTHLMRVSADSTEFVTIDNNTTIVGVTNIREAGASGSIYYNNNETKTSLYTTHGERIINQTATDTIEISSFNIAKYGHELTVFNSTGSGLVIVTTEGSELINGKASYNVIDNTTFRMNGSNVDIIQDGASNVRGLNSNVFIGLNAGINATGVNNTSVGNFSGDAITGGAGNSNFGTFAGSSISTQANNSYFGYQAGESNTGANNTSIGWRSLRQNTGDKNIGIGSLAGNGGVFDNNIFIGYTSGQNSAIMGNSTGIGSESLKNHSNVADPGTLMTAIGFRAAYESNASSDGSVSIGYQANDLGPHREVVTIGYNIDSDKDYQVKLGSANAVELAVRNYVWDTDQDTTGLDGQVITFNTGDGQLSLEPKSSETDITLAAAATTLTITTDVVTVTGDAGANTLATITGGYAGQILTLIFVDALVTLTDTEATTADTFNLSAAFTSTPNDAVTFRYNGNKWFEMGRSLN